MKILKISGLSIDSSDEEHTSDLKYPPAGTKMSKIVECLEAECADLREIADYLDSSTELPRIKGLLNHLLRRGLVRKKGDRQWELVDPVGAAMNYGSDV